MGLEKEIRNKTIRYKSRLYIIVGFFLILIGIGIYVGKIMYNNYLDSKDIKEVEEFLTENLKWEKKEASNASNETKKEENQQKEEDL